MAGVRILNVSHVSLSSPPPQESVELSFLDYFWLCLPPLPQIFLYDNGAGLPFSSLVDSLKSSLSATLSVYYPLAGKLSQLLGSNGSVIVDCSPSAVGAGVAFIEAESDMDFTQLAEDETHDVEAFRRLVPKLDSGVLPVPVLAVQVTRSVGGGVAVGATIHHAVVDGLAISAFIEAWAGACRTGTMPGPIPSHDRAAIKHPKGYAGAEQFLRVFAPDLPSIVVPTFTAQVGAQAARRTFTIKPSSVQSLKERAKSQCKSNPIVQFSTFVTMSAHAWISFTQAKALENDDESFLLCLADCRPRLEPPLGENFFGNCIKPCYAKAKVSDLLAEDGLAHACMTIKQAIDERLKDPLVDCDEWAGIFETIPLQKMLCLNGSPRLKFYDVDFGWGKARRMEMISTSSNGEVVYMGTTTEGCIRAAVGLTTVSEMNAFSSLSFFRA